MKKLEELIENLCSNGVEYKKLSDVCKNITTGKLNANAMNKNGKYPFFTCDAKPFKIDEYAFDEEAIIISGNGSKVGHINYYKGKFNAYQRTYVLYNFKDILIKFLLHYLNGTLKEYIMLYCKKGSIPYITLPMLQNFMIPVPPLEVQNEIVYILDKFTELSTELSEELKTRKQQFEYYRDKLLKVEGKIEKLGDITNFRTGSKPKNILEEKDYRTYEYINAGTTNSGFVYEKNFKKDVVTTPSRGEGGIGFVGYQDNEFWLGPLCYAIWSKNEEILINKYLYYELLSKKDEILKRKNTGGVPSLNGYDLKTISINIPPLEKQERIVSILNKFEKLCNDISEGLPAEIEARQKQYEYYRDKLLSFKEFTS